MKPLFQARVLIALSFLVAPLSAAESAGDLLAQAAKSWNLDQPIPAAPAFTALGVTPETVTHPATPREFATSLLNGVDKDGQLQAGVAIDLAPYQLLYGAETSLSDYRASSLTRFLYNLQLSIATAKTGEKDGKSMRLAAGFQFTVFNHGDLRRNTVIDDHVDAFVRAAGIPKLRPGLSAEEADSIWRDGARGSATELNSKIKKIRDENWAASSMFLAASPVWLSKSGKADELKADGATYWGTYAWGFEGIKALHKKAQFLAHVRYRERETVTDATTPTTTYRQNTVFGAARLRFGRPDLHFSVEGGIIEQRPRGRPEVRIHRIGGSVETRLRENLWIVVSFGNDIAKSPGADDSAYTLAGLRFGASENPTLKLGN